MSWQPIETAPKDGTRILAWAEQYDAPVTAEHNGGSGEWCVHGYRLVFQPTHWMPVPPPAVTT